MYQMLHTTHINSTQQSIMWLYLLTYFTVCHQMTTHIKILLLLLLLLLLCNKRIHIIVLKAEMDKTSKLLKQHPF